MTTINTATGKIALTMGAAITLKYPMGEWEQPDEHDAFEGWVLCTGAGPSDTEAFRYAGPVGDMLSDGRHKYVAQNEISEKRLTALKTKAEELGIELAILEL